MDKRPFSGALWGWRRASRHLDASVCLAATRSLREVTVCGPGQHLMALWGSPGLPEAPVPRPLLPPHRPILIWVIITDFLSTKACVRARASPDVRGGGAAAVIHSTRQRGRSCGKLGAQASRLEPAGGTSWGVSGLVGFHGLRTGTGLQGGASTTSGRGAAAEGLRFPEAVGLPGSK